MTDERDVPSGRLGRFARLAMLGVRTGTNMLFDRKSDGSALAAQATEVLGNLRGLAAKVGQMASYVDGIVGPEQRDAFEKTLKTLRANTPASPPDKIRTLMIEEFGSPPEEIFGTWNDTPIASASIGQVHRATLKDGTPVAVKVQHPGIAKALESDLSNAGILQSIAAVAGGKKLDTKTVFESIRARFREELDYRLEAERTQFFKKMFASDPLVQVPTVFPELTNARVIVTSWADGLDFDAACAASKQDRERWASTMWHFVFKGNLVGAHFNADPHPGNYIFQPDGQVTFLDFGCVQQIPDEAHLKAIDVHREALRGDEKAFRAAGRVLISSKPGRLEDAALDFLRACFTPLFDRPSHLTREFVAGLVKQARGMAMIARKAEDREIFHMPGHMVFMNRLQFGFYSVLARLDVAIDYAAMEQQIWGEIEQEYQATQERLAGATS